MNKTREGRDRRCPKCEVTKPLYDFYTNGWCKECNRTYSKKRREKLARSIREESVIAGRISLPELSDEEVLLALKAKRERDAEQEAETLTGTSTDVGVSDDPFKALENWSNEI